MHRSAPNASEYRWAIFPSNLHIKRGLTSDYLYTKEQFKRLAASFEHTSNFTRVMRVANQIRCSKRLLQYAKRQVNATDVELLKGALR